MNHIQGALGNADRAQQLLLPVKEVVRKESYFTAREREKEIEGGR